MPDADFAQQHLQKEQTHKRRLFLAVTVVVVIFTTAFIVYLKGAFPTSSPPSSSPTSSAETVSSLTTRLVIAVFLDGRTANHALLWASAVGIAIANNNATPCILRAHRWERFLSSFIGSFPDCVIGTNDDHDTVTVIENVPQRGPYNWLEHSRTHVRFFDDTLMDLRGRRAVNANKNTVVKLQHYLQSFRYFVAPAAAARMKRDFQLYRAVRLAANEFMRVNVLSPRNISSRSAVKLIAIHQRRGDMKEVQSLPAVFYENAMRFFTEIKYPEKRVLFIVVGEDGAWSASRPYFSRDGTGSSVLKDNVHVVRECNPVAFDMALMRYCDDFIYSFYTFSWFNAWMTTTYSGGDVVYSEQYLSVDSYHSPDYYPPWWIPADAVTGKLLFNKTQPRPSHFPPSSWRRSGGGV